MIFNWGGELSQLRETALLTTSHVCSTQRIATTPEEDRATAIGNMYKNFVKIARAVPEISSRTDRHAHTHTHKHTDNHHNTSQPLPRAK